MLTVITDIHGIRPAENHILNHELSLLENIMLAVPNGADVAEVWLNGLRLEDFNESDDLDRNATALDSMRVVLRPAGLDPFSLTLAIVIGIVAAVAAVALIPKPQVPNDMGAGKQSPNNQLQAQTNIARLYQARPDVYGQVRSYPDLMQQSTIEYINNVKFLTEWLYFGDGKYTVEQVKYADTPIADFAGASYEIFYPTETGLVWPENSTTTLSDVTESFASPEVNGQTLEPPGTDFSGGDPPITEAAATVDFPIDSATFDITVAKNATKWADLLTMVGTTELAQVQFQWQTDQGPRPFNQLCECTSYVDTGTEYIFTFICQIVSTAATNAVLTVTVTPRVEYTGVMIGPFTLPVEANQIRINFAFLRGLKGSVTLSIRFWAVDSVLAEIPGSREEIFQTYSGDTFDQQYRTKNITPLYGNGIYRVEVERVTPSSTSDDTDQIKVESLFAINYYATKTIPGGTAARVTNRATENATSGQEKKFNALITRHVRKMDGTLYVVEPSRCFARSIYHLVTVQAKFPQSQIDLDSLEDILASNGGENSELMRFDGTFDDTDVSLGQRVATIANAARTGVIDNGQTWTFVRDQLRSEYPVAQFDYRNLAADGESQVSYKSPMANSKDGVTLEYVSPTTNKKTPIHRRILADGSIVNQQPVNALKVDMSVGCRTLSQAVNRLEYEVRRLLYIRRTVTDKTLADAQTIGPGNLVRWIDPGEFFEGVLSAGEVLNVDGLKVETSEPVNIDTTSAVAFTDYQGLQLGPVACSPRTDGKNGFVVSSLPVGVYLADGYNVQAGSRYFVGNGLSISQLNASSLYLVTQKQPNQDGSCNITLENYEPLVYAED